MVRRILVVEDNFANRMLVKDVLEFHGYEILEAEDGQAGIEMAKKYKPDLILMDLQMPLMDGVTAGKIIRGDPDTKDIKMIAVTSFAMSGDKERIMEAGFDHYISKPINTRELSDLIKEIIQLFSLFSIGIIADRSRNAPSLIRWCRYYLHHIIAGAMKRSAHIGTLLVILGRQRKKRFVVRTHPQRHWYIHQIEEGRKIVQMGNPDAGANAG